MARWYTVDPMKVCGEQHNNTTIAYHECLCQFNYASQTKRKMGMLKFRHCALADEMRKQMDFDMYKIIGFSCVVFVVIALVLFCSFKWYQQTKKNPCVGCCSCFSCLFGKKKKRRAITNGHCNGTSGHDARDSSAGFDEHWAQEMNSDMGSLHHNGQAGNGNKKKKSTLCMKFCLSEPVQDCCEFFDCDLMWHKKNVYAQPYFGRSKKPSQSGGELNGAYGMTGGPSPTGPVDNVPTLQRRPTRPAPPPPKLPGAPGSACHNVPIFDDGSLIVDDDIVCDPIPEAPPSPEPVRSQQADQPRSIYVDPLAFLQKPFLRLSIALSGKDSNPRDSRAEGKDEDEPDALYSRVKDFVMSKVRKSSSIVSLNRASGGVSSNPDGRSESPTKGKKYGKTASMASLHDITETDLDKSYDGNKRSMSLASLASVSTQHANGGVGGNKSRHGSRHNLADEDVPPNQRDEYIDLEEMARKMAARMQQQQQQQQQKPPEIQKQHQYPQQQQVHPDLGNNIAPVVTSQPLSVQALQQQLHSPSTAHDTSMASVPQLSPARGKTPDFIPASAYGAAKPSNDTNSNKPANYEIGPSVLYPNNSQPNVATILGSSSHQSGTAFSPSNFSSFQTDPHNNSSVTALVDATGAVPLSIVASSANPQTLASPPQNSPVNALVPYSGPRQEPQGSAVSSVSSTPAGTLKRNKPSVPPRPAGLSDNPNYKSLGRSTVVPPSPKLLDPRRNPAGPYGKLAVPGMGTLPRSPLVPNKPGVVGSIPPLSLHEQQILQQQLIQQQQLQQFYLQQNPHLNPAYQQLLLQQQLLQEHTIMTPSVQQQVLQEQQLYQQMLQQQQHYQMQQQYQQQLLQQQLQQGMRYRQPLSSASSTGSTSSSKSLRSVHKPSHPPPPPPSSGPPGASIP